MSDDVRATSGQAGLAARRSRRALLAGAVAGAGALVVRSLGDPVPALAAGDDGSTLHIGDLYANAQSQTTIANQANSGRVLWVASNADAGHGDGVAITGFSASSTGVEGFSNTGKGLHGHTNGAGTAVLGESGSGLGVWGIGSRGVHGSGSTVGVLGNSQGAGVMGYSGPTAPHFDPPANVGVYGHAVEDAGSRGVWGHTDAGRGVFGEATSGTGLFGKSASGYALRTSGRVKADKVSGVATVAAGNQSVTLSPGVNVTSSSFVLLTPKANIGGRDLWYTTDASHNKITIHLSSARSKATRVAWLLMG